MTPERKAELKRMIARRLGQAAGVRKAVIFGAFLTRELPNDIDIPVFQDTDEAYLPLALKYRRMARAISEVILLDIIPVRPGATGALLNELSQGEVIYER